MNPEYMSDKRREYKIIQKGNGWGVSPYGGGLIPVPIQGIFSFRRDLEKALVNYLSETNKYGRAIWPGH